LIGSVLHFLLRKKQIPTPYPINIGRVKKRRRVLNIDQNGASNFASKIWQAPYLSNMKIFQRLI